MHVELLDALETTLRPTLNRRCNARCPWVYSRSHHGAQPLDHSPDLYFAFQRLTEGLDWTRCKLRLNGPTFDHRCCTRWAEVRHLWLLCALWKPPSWMLSA